MLVSPLREAAARAWRTVMAEYAGRPWRDEGGELSLFQRPSKKGRSPFRYRLEIAGRPPEEGRVADPFRFDETLHEQLSRRFRERDPCSPDPFVVEHARRVLRWAHEAAAAAGDPKPSDLRTISHGTAIDDAAGYSVSVDWRRVVYRERHRTLHVDADMGADPPIFIIYTGGPWRWLEAGSGAALSPAHKRLARRRIAAALERLDVSHAIDPPPSS